MVISGACSLPGRNFSAGSDYPVWRDITHGSGVSPDRYRRTQERGLADEAGGFEVADEVDQGGWANETAEVDQAIRLDPVDEAGETDSKSSPRTESRNNNPHHTMVSRTIGN